MPLAIRPSDLTGTYEDRIERIMNALSKMPNQFDAQLIRNLILELCRRYDLKSRELGIFTNIEIEALDRRFTDQIIKDLNLGL